jgi:hypothetical protein
VSEAAAGDALVAQLARSAVAETAPEELPLFRATSEAYFEDPAALERGGPGDELLGFGVDAALVLVTPVALSVARDVLNFVLEQVREQAREHGKDAIDRFADRLLRRTKTDGEGEAPPEQPGGEPAPLSDEQLEQVRALAVEKATQLKLSPDRAELHADSLVGSLATA